MKKKSGRMSFGFCQAETFTKLSSFFRRKSNNGTQASSHPDPFCPAETFSGVKYAP
jgi:hypothetical protein